MADQEIHYDRNGDPIQDSVKQTASSGGEVHYDRNGNLIDISKSPYLKQTPEEIAKIRASKKVSEIDRTTPDAAKYTEYAPLIGGIAGEIAGGPLISGMGSMAGDLLHLGVTHLRDKNITPSDIGEAVLSGALNTGMGFASRAIPALKQNLMRPILNKAFPLEQIPGDAAAMIDSASLKPTVAQATGSSFARGIERTLAHPQLVDREIQQTGLKLGALDDLRAKFGMGSKSVPLEQAGESGQQSILGRLRSLESKEDTAFNEVRKHAENNTTNFTYKVGEEPSGVLDASGNPIMKDVMQSTDVKGPITITKSLNFIKKLNDEIKDIPFADLPDIDKTKLGKLKNVVDNILKKPNALDANGNPVLSWDRIKQLRTDINASNEGIAFKSRQEGGLQEISNQLSQDIQDSISGWNNGGKALSDLSKANLITSAKYKVFDADPVLRSMGKDFRIGQFANSSEFFNQALSSPEAAAKLRTAIGPDGFKDIKGAFFDKLTSDSFNEAGQAFNPDKVINELRDINSPYRKIFTAPERADWIHLMRQFRATEPNSGDAGQMSMAIRKGYFMLYAVPGILGLSGHGTVAAEGLSLIVGAQQFARHIMMDPKYARLAAKLPSLASDSFEASNITKGLIKALRGAQVYAMTPSGVKISGTINDKGKFEQDPTEAK